MRLLVLRKFPITPSLLQDVYIDRDTLKDRLEMVAEWMLRDCLIRQRGVPEVDLGQLVLALGDMSIASIR